MKVKSQSEVIQSYLALSDPVDCSLPGSSVHGFSRREYRSGVPLPSLTLPSCPTLEPWKVGHRLDWTDIAKVMRWFCFWVWPNEHIAVPTFLTDAFFRLMERFI